VANPRLTLRRADTGDFEAVRSLLSEASQWLGTKNTDQWAVPWPDENGCKTHIKRAIRAGHTWIVLDNKSRPAATLTISPNHHGIWADPDGPEPAVYVRRITVSRQFAGQGLGSELLDWAGLRANRDYGARWIRVDVWTTNLKLHEYYRRQGFHFLGLCSIPGYPSAALFQKAIDQIKPLEAHLFREDQGSGRG
jgi:GNAT superfamily N-acetyltransferase